jgi:hypothetical protein
VALVINGIKKYWSGTVKSVNHQSPPVLKLSTGTLAMPRSPIKNETKTGI